MKYDYLIVGTGLYGAVVAQKLYAAGKKILMLDKRCNIAGKLIKRVSWWMPANSLVLIIIHVIYQYILAQPQ